MKSSTFFDSRNAFEYGTSSHRFCSFQQHSWSSTHAQRSMRHTELLEQSNTRMLNHQTCKRDIGKSHWNLRTSCIKVKSTTSPPAKSPPYQHRCWSTTDVGEQIYSSRQEDVSRALNSRWAIKHSKYSTTTEVGTNKMKIYDGRKERAVKANQRKGGERMSLCWRNLVFKRGLQVRKRLGVM